MYPAQHTIIKWLMKYENFVRTRQPTILADADSIEFWKTQLFYTLLIYGLPISLIATFPGIYLSVTNHDSALWIVDLATFLGFLIIAFTGKLPLQTRKLLLIGLFYPFALYLICVFGFIGPGVFYLFGLTVISALILSELLAYCAILFSTLILIIPDMMPHVENMAFSAPPITFETHIAFACNFLFLSALSVTLILRVLNRLREALLNKQQLTRHYQMLFDKSPLPMWLFDTETLKFKNVNEAAIRHYGYSEEEFTGMKITDIRPPADNDSISAIVQANRISGLPHEQYVRHYKKNGELIHVQIQSSLLTVDGKSLRLVLATDITELIKNQAQVKAANERIQQSEADLRAIFESTVDGLVLIDSRNRIKQFNARATDYIRFSQLPQEFEAGQNIFNYVPRLLHEDFRQLLLRTQAGETIEYDRQYGIAHTTMWVHYSLNPVYTGSSVTGVCVTGRDITPLKNYITQIEEQNKLFREIAWTQSHIVRAPVARLSGLLSLLQHPATDEDLQVTLKYIGESVAELDDIVISLIHRSHEATSMEQLIKKI